MAKRRTKKRTHAAANPNSKSGVAPGPGKLDPNNPKSMVIRIGAGEVGSSISQLATDVRRVMEPGTASRLKERKANRLRDYVTMCGPLGVTHLLLFSRSETGNTNLRVCTTPQGPTLHFRVEKYSLAKDVRRAQRHPKGGGKEYITPPLLVMNQMTSEPGKASENVPRHLETLVSSVFHGLFPPINPQVAPLKSIRRVLLLNRERSSKNDGSYVLNFRHYAITTKVTGVSKAVKRLNAAERLMNSKSRKGKLPNLSKLQDIADYMIGGENGEGYTTDGTSGSEADTDAEVEVMDVAGRKKVAPRGRPAPAEEEGSDDDEGTEANGHDKVERRAVKLVELGPRMKLRLTKVEDGMCAGKVMWHEYIHKSKEEIRELEKLWEKRRQEKEVRRQQQRENVEKKKAAKKAKKGTKDGEASDEDEDEMDLDDLGSDAYDYMDENEFDSEGLEGDAEAKTNEEADENGEWSDEEEQIADHR
ncbi:Brix-domain-containing protein [Cryphonectria parasitica EP155]|uniref:Brix-domain-containing protein n=1 Tax=Cryphonectria parasitica (strain ATCC 38755 / EP155) TaxID=660469 RepID=A0A9P4Y6E3_CRYP1|nr:Brix-domain-containing protein [Cryphonectria parasitica EP155]KAF3767294.1 Brix-domain-containing protein [Cryphonectria parasitica EP155]